MKEYQKILLGMVGIYICVLFIALIMQSINNIFELRSALFGTIIVGTFWSIPCWLFLFDEVKNRWRTGKPCKSRMKKIGV